MGEAQQVEQLYQNLISSEQLAYGTYPSSADTVSATAIVLTAAGGAWTWGAWAEIVSAAGVTADQQIWGITLEDFSGGASQGEVEIGTGAGGGEVARIRVPSVGAVYTLPKPLRVASGTRIAARYRTSTGVADTVAVKLCRISGF